MNTDLPGHEADRFNYGRLDDLLSRENAPRDGIGPVRMGVGPEISSPVDHVVRDVRVTLNLWYQRGQELRGDEELKISLASVS